MATTTDYTNRKVDLSFFPPSDPGTPVLMGIQERGAFVVTGKFKAAAHFLKNFLSADGRYENPEHGTDFLARMSQGVFFPIQVQQAFSEASIRCLKWMSDNYAPETPLDERVDRVVLVSYSSPTRTSIFLNVDLYTQAGEAASFVIPIAWSE